MIYKVTHSTWYTYTEPVPFCHNVVHLAPRPHRWQQCRTHELRIDPQPDFISFSTDYFGNRTDYFALQRLHRGLKVTGLSEVEVTPPKLPNAESTAAWDLVIGDTRLDTSAAGLEAQLLMCESSRVEPTDEIKAYAAQSFPPGRPILEGAAELNSRIYKDFTFDPRATTVNTPLADVMKLRRGVCQDFAHLAIGCFRSLGLSARYVSGYICTNPPPGSPRLVGADASHAWISLYCGKAGWIDLDPTNNMLVADCHITIGWGRDYGDVCPVQGVFIGGGDHKMGVSVDVAPRPDGKRQQMQAQQQ